MTRPVVITRPQPDADRFAADLAALGVPSLISPVLIHAPLKPDWPPTAPDGLILASRHALASQTLPVGWRTLPTLCVGAATAQAAQSAGQTHVIDAGGTADDILTHLSIQPTRTAWLYLHGTAPDPRLLYVSRHMERTVTGVQTYRMAAATGLNAAVAAQAERTTPCILTCFSTRTAEIACTLLSMHKHVHWRDAWIGACISTRTAAVLYAAGMRTVHVANQPDAKAMLGLTHRLSLHDKP